MRSFHSLRLYYLHKLQIPFASARKEFLQGITLLRHFHSRTLGRHFRA
ncbi:unnamed protein product, partial [Amoebophrya sp. A120]|eukprot:GSA120T00018132001.1